MNSRRLIQLSNNSVSYGGRLNPNSSLQELARIRGDMWGVRCNVPYGRRPNRDDNICAMDYLEVYTSEQQARMIAAYKASGMSHAPVGPLVDTFGYHGDYPTHPDDPTQTEWDAFVDILELMWQAGIVPVFFLKPDNWTFARTKDVFQKFLLQPRSQQLIRIIVPMGWEPDYNMSSFTHEAMNRWIANILPRALRLLHTPSDRDAPVGTDEMGDDNGVDNAVGINRVIPLLHGWLLQNGPYGATPQADPITAKNFAAQFQESGFAADAHSIGWHFRPGGPWTRDSAWGFGKRILLYAGEETAYNQYWHDLPESVGNAWGDLAMSVGAAGYFNGGTVDVPLIEGL
jgi:hypothetical protein